jgi:glutamate synthase (NADPH/NADH) large chain
MAQLGFRTLNDMIGHVDSSTCVAPSITGRQGGVDLTKLLYQVPAKPGVAIWNSERQDHGLDKALDHKLIAAASPLLRRGQPVQVELPVGNVNRTVGAMLSGEVAKRYGHIGLPGGHDLGQAHRAPPARASAPSWRTAYRSR